jgi:hypothetical protein
VCPSSDLPAMVVRTRHGFQARQQLVAADEAEGGRVARELEVFVAAGTEFAQHQVVGFHAPSRVLGDPHWKCSCLPVGRGECRGAGAHALGVVAVLDVEVAGLAEDEGDSIGELLVIAWRDDVHVAGGRE